MRLLEPEILTAHLDRFRKSRRPPASGTETRQETFSGTAQPSGVYSQRICSANVRKIQGKRPLGSPATNGCLWRPLAVRDRERGTLAHPCHRRPREKLRVSAARTPKLATISAKAALYSRPFGGRASGSSPPFNLRVSLCPVKFLIERRSTTIRARPAPPWNQPGRLHETISHALSAHGVSDSTGPPRRQLSTPYSMRSSRLSPAATM